MDGGLFTTPDYLEPLDDCACASPRSGWRAAHLRGPDGFVMCYEKSHSWGEFVFDFQFAEAYARSGLDYYPKLVSCIPFTPVPGPRLVATHDMQRRALAKRLVERARERGCSGAHVLFLPPDEAALLEADGWLRRDQFRYLWHNRGYASFDDFLERLAGKKRKNIRRERRRVHDSGLEIRWQAGIELDDAEWQRVFELYSSTYLARGQAPYLDLRCLRRWAANFAERMQFCLARRSGAIVAMAFFFHDGEALYGRHWGAAEPVDGLHFELCYYQGIERCIAGKLRLFDAGVQGEHKLARGFELAFSHSAHWFAHREFQRAIARFFERERQALSSLAGQMRAHGAFAA